MGHTPTVAKYTKRRFETEHQGPSINNTLITHVRTDITLEPGDNARGNDFG